MATNSIMDLSQLNFEEIVREIGVEEVTRMLKIVVENNIRATEHVDDINKK